MFSIPKAAWLAACAVASVHALTAEAQGPAAPPPSAEPAPHPADAKAAVPAALYRSPLTGYQAHADTPVAPWRDSNERVRQRGGWRAYAREARAPALVTPADAAASAAASPAQVDHLDHPQK